jgi:hypothetical protein
VEQLLGNTEFVSSDFTNFKALADGDVNGRSYMGFMFHQMSPDVLNDSPATDRFYGFAWHMRSMGLAMGMDIMVDVDKRPDKRNAQQVYVSGVFGGVRIEDGVVRLDIDEA